MIKSKHKLAWIYYYELMDKIYVGSTVNTVSRQRQHVVKEFGWNRKNECSDRIKLNCLELVDYKNKLYWENFYMELFKSWGFELMNKQKINAIYYGKR